MQSKKNDHQVFVALGANLGDRTKQIQKALSTIEKQVGSIVTISSFYETDPWGEEDQEKFINAVALIHTLLKPVALLQALQLIEKDLKKYKSSRWGPRTIDLDILYYGEKIIVEKDLIIPHPNMYLRNFVLIPLNEIAPDFIHPVLKKPTKSLLLECPDKGEVVKIN